MTARDAERDSRSRETERDWYKDAVIYQIHVKSFMDGNDDGIGDFAGLIDRLDYIASLGVDTLWLLPFYPSPRRDDGYDVADYLSVHPEYGSFDQLRRFLDAAHARGLRVIGDLVLNHTSDAHPWFERARHAPHDSPEHAFYVWSDNDQAYAGTRIIFPDVEKSNWAWDPVAGRYYFHRFYAHQPDLNFANPAVLDAMLDVLRFWLDLGLDGFRLDAVAYLAEREGTSNENLPETHAILKRLRAVIDADYPDRMLLAEANQWPEDMQHYFGDDDECHMAFHFPLMPRMYMAIAQEDRLPIIDILRQTPPTPPRSQWAIFLRNHDELTLEMVTDAERDYLWNTYADDPRARLNLGIRRRLAPLLQGDRRRIELMSALLFTLPGTPVLYYGDEIGMGDNLHLGDRDGVRTPMQWSVDRNGGFSRVEPQRLVLPMVDDPVYGPHAVNVEAQERDPHSLLHWTRHWLAVRRRFGPLFGRGELRFLTPRNRKVLVFLRQHDGISVLCAANLSRTLQAVELDLAAFEGQVPVELTGAAALPPIGNAPYLLTLAPYGFVAVELAGRDRLPDWYVPEPEPLPELQTLVLRDVLAHDLARVHVDLLGQSLVPGWWRRRPRAAPLPESGVRVGSLWPLRADSDAVMVEVVAVDGAAPLALLPLGIDWEDGKHLPPPDPLALARVRRGARIGRLTEATAQRSLYEHWRGAWQQQQVWGADHGKLLQFEREDAAELPAAGDSELRLLAPDAAADAAILDQALLICTERVAPGAMDGGVQLLRHLACRGFAHAPRLLGTLALRGEHGEQLIATLQAAPDTDCDAREWTFDFLRRALHEFRAAPAARRDEVLRGFDPFIDLLGARLSELHRLLAEIADPGASDTTTTLTAANLRERLIDGLQHCSSQLPKALRPSKQRIRGLCDRVDERAAQATAITPPLQRIHGNLLLQNLRLGAGGLCFIRLRDPAGAIAPRGDRCAPAIADVADLLHGFDVVAEAFAHEADDRSALLATFLQRFRRRAHARLLGAYTANDGPTPAASEAAEAMRAWLDLHCTRRGLQEIEHAAHPRALAAAWGALRRRLGRTTPLSHAPSPSATGAPP